MDFPRRRPAVGVRQTFVLSQTPQVFFVMIALIWALIDLVATHRVQYESWPSMNSYLHTDRLFFAFWHQSLAGQMNWFCWASTMVAIMNTTNVVTRMMSKNFIAGLRMCVGLRRWWVCWTKQIIMSSLKCYRASGSLVVIGHWIFNPPKLSV